MKGDLDIYKKMNKTKIGKICINESSGKIQIKAQITIFIIIAILIIAMVAVIFTLSPKFKKTEEILEKIYCNPEQRNADVCIQLYEPVCGWFDSEKVQCIRHPCAQTYSNFCFACMDKNVEFYTPGECE